MEQPYRDNALIVKRVGMLPGASAEYASLSMNVQYIKKQAASNLIQPIRICVEGMGIGYFTSTRREKSSTTTM